MILFAYNYPRKSPPIWQLPRQSSLQNGINFRTVLPINTLLYLVLQWIADMHSVSRYGGCLVLPSLHLHPVLVLLILLAT